jgi:hypothetical protein
MREWLRAVRELDWRGWLMLLAFFVGFPVALAVFALVVMRLGLFVGVFVLVVAPLLSVFAVGLLVESLREAMRKGAARWRSLEAMRAVRERRRAAGRHSWE